ncbi:hypothetical protein CALCODRAFT_464917 [Calocera cornea HHB12733]|uniref:Ubiquitin-like domain-containing protein n=1 Tax=Calocera cornea HHB12733 TaxID=1353952 RepID=A0A165ITY9_9BASI|nr:hypothetical protein CALCODRAFT_464917 [Calocera cornea HHB12733]
MSRTPSSGSPAPAPNTQHRDSEAAFVRQQLATLDRLTSAYNTDYVPPLSELPRRPPLVPVHRSASLAHTYASPPARANVPTESISITIKSLKPALSFPLQISPLDPISTLKHTLAQHPRAPPADAQRLLLKGKALADTRLVKEYALEQGAVVTLMVKPGVEWTGEERVDESAMEVDLPAPVPAGQLAAEGAGSPQLTPGGHPIPTLTLSTEVPSRPQTPGTAPLPSTVHTVSLNTDLASITTPGPQPDPGTSASYHSTISSAQFWTRLFGFLKLQFEEEDDAAKALEDFLLASKSALSAGEIAQIRETVGIVGMGGKGL